MTARADRCTSCRAPRNHPAVRCDACGRAYSHATGVYTHALRDHSLSRRIASLIADRALHAARGWPLPSLPPELAHLIGPKAAAEVPA